MQAKNPLLQCSTRLLAVVIENGNAPIEHELPRAIRATADCAVFVIHDEVKPYAQGLRYDLDTNIDQGLQTLDLQEKSYTDKFKVVYEVVMPEFQACVKGLREQIKVALEYDRKKELSELSLAAMRASQTFAQGPGRNDLSGVPRRNGAQKSSVCNYWHLGKCNRGDSCRFQHPPTWQPRPTNSKSSLKESTGKYRIKSFVQYVFES